MGRNLLRKSAVSVARILAAHVIVTPFLPFILSTHFLSDEVYKEGVTLLNPRARDLSKTWGSAIKGLRVVYCETKLLPEFRETFLPKLPEPFVLLTGSLHLPDLDSELARQVLLDIEKRAIVWFSHNPPFESGQPWGFPFGSPYQAGYLTLLSSAKYRMSMGRSAESLVPFFRVHNHLGPRARAERESLKPFMDAERNFHAYLRSIGTHRYVLSPQGDRPDTYRHWESILLGSYPVTTLPPQYRGIFEESMVFTTDLARWIQSPQRTTRGRLAPIRPGLVTFWRRKLSSELRSLEAKLP